MPKAKLLGFKVYADPARTVELSFRDGKAKPADPPPGAGGRERRGPVERRGPGKGKEKGRTERGSTAFSPYTGQVAGQLNPQEHTVFKVAGDLHRWLLAGEVGKVLTGLSALFILVITATGLVLWWPKTRAVLTGRLRIKWGSSWKRVNYDLHIVLGFYCSLFLFGLALTGIIMSYHWGTGGLFQLTGTKPTVGIAALVSAAAGSLRAVAYDAALRTGQATYRGAEFWQVSAPKDSLAAVAVSAPSSLPPTSLRPRHAICRL